MTRLPRAAALWLLLRVCGETDDNALLGDLLEEEAAGRSTMWLWRQVIAAALATTSSEIRRQWRPIARAVATGLIALPLFQFTAALVASTWVLGLRSLVAGALVAAVIRRIAGGAGSPAVIVFAVCYVALTVPWVLLASTRLDPPYLAFQAAAIAATVGGLLAGGIVSRRLAIAACLLVAAEPAMAQESAIAFVNVNVIPMSREDVRVGQTVVVRGDRIAEIGPAAAVVIPAGSAIVDGSGRYLLPGLVDAHVHLEGGPFWQGSRDDFGDAPLYLSHGVTSVLNLRGTAEFLDWRDRIRAGRLLGPNLYTTGDFIIGEGGPTIRGPSGEFLVGPSVTTEAEVERVVAAQARDRVDAIKYYGGLSRRTYLGLTNTARAAGIPLIGHSPDHLGMDTWLEGRQALAHVHQLTNLHFFPPGALFAHIPVLLATALSLFVLVVVALTSIPPRRLERMLVLVMALGAMGELLAFGNGSYGESLVQRLAISFVAVVVAAAAAFLLLRLRSGWRTTPRLERGRFATAAIAGIVLCFVLATFWVPIAWRGTPDDMERVAARTRDAGIPVQTTLVVWSETAARAALTAPAFEHLPPAIRDRWRAMGVDAAGYLSPQFLAFQQRVTGALHRAGVSLVAGTDALGAPFVIPGFSLHQELALIAAAGLSPFDAIRTATANAAAFLGQLDEFGTVDVGKRADVLLLEANPLDDLTNLMRPLGVMVRGRWLPRTQLDEMLEGLK